MTEIEARAELALLVDASSDPALSDADLDLCLRKARRVDAAGLLVSDPNWAPTFSMHAAAAAAWGLKAARAASRTDFSADGATFTRSQLVAQCRAQARTHLAQLGGPVRLSGEAVTL